jgi:hypothetical protein
MPGSFQVAASGGVPNTRGLPAVRGFATGDNAYYEYTYVVAGTTKDATGVALAGCTVMLFRTSDNSCAAVGVSDASGAYRLAASAEIAHYAVAYKAGGTDVAGTTVNTLVGT